MVVHATFTLPQPPRKKRKKRKNPEGKLRMFREVVCIAIAQYQHELTPEPSEM